MSTRLNGFLDLYFDGHPIWIRKEYEKINHNKSECERLCDYIGFHTKDLNLAISKARDIDTKLVYKRYNKFIDNALENKYGKNQFQWITYKQGYLNLITYEYVASGNKPDRCGLPFWVKTSNNNYVSYGENQTSSLSELLSYLLTIIFK